MKNSRHELLWLAIRLAGVFFILKAVLALPVIPARIFEYNSLRSQTALLSEYVEPSKAEKVNKLVTKNLFCAVTDFVLYLGVGVYLCRRGKLLYTFIKNPIENEN